MHINYTAVDGYSLNDSSVLAALMADADADMVVDQTGNSNTLTENGTVTTAVVGTGATTLVASGFSSSNYYSRAYDADFDPATSGFSLGAWVKFTATSSDYIVERDSNPTAQRYVLYTDAAGTVSGRVDDNTTVRTVTSAGALNDDNWHYVVLVFDGSILTLYVDGALNATTTGAALNTLTNTSAVLRIGNGVNTSLPFDAGSIAGVELDIGAQWTAEEIRQKYELGKILFQNYELFSIVGQAIDWENEAQQIIPHFVTGTNYQKLGHHITTDYIATSERAALMKFLKSTNYYKFSEALNGWRSPDLSFSLDLLGTAASPDDPRTVYKISNNEQPTPLGATYLSAAFSVREK